MAARRPFWKWHIAKNQQASAQSHKHYAHEIWNWKSKANSRNHAAYRKRKRKIQYGHLAAILKMTMKINRLLPIYTSIVLLNFGVQTDIQSQTIGRARKPKNPRWPSGGHFGSDVTENWIGFCLWLQQYVYEIWNWNSKANLTYAPETMSSTDGWMDRRTDRLGEFGIPPPTSLGRGIIQANKTKNLYVLLCPWRSISHA